MPICESCGANFADTFKFCPFCGREKPAPISAMTNLTSRIHECPICHLNDKVEKVSIIYARERQDTQMTVPVGHVGKDFFTDEPTYSVSYEQMHGMNETELAQQLRPPEKPTEPYKYQKRHNEKLWTIMAVPLGLCGSVSIVGEGLAQNTNNSRAGMIILILLVWAAITAGIIWYTKYDNRKLQQKDADYDVKLAEYEKDFDAWNHLYLCYRDGKVFASQDPG